MTRVAVRTGRGIDVRARSSTASLGLQYGLLGVGLTLIYGLGGILNLAQGQVAVAGAIAISVLIGNGWAAVPAVLVGLAAGALMAVIDLTLMRPVYRQEGEARVLMGLLVMLGVAFVIDGSWSGGTRSSSCRCASAATPCRSWAST